MGRPSKLTPQDEAEIKKRLLNGDKPADIAKDYNVSRPLIIGRFADSVRNVKDTANQILAVEDKFHNLPVSDKLTVISLTDRLRNISNNLAGTAENGSLTAYILSGVASRQAAKIDKDDPMESQEILQAISALTKISNDASAVGLNLLNANKDKQIDPVVQKRKIITIRKAEETCR